MKNTIAWTTLTIIGVFVALLAPLPVGTSEFSRTLQDLLHAPLFSGVAIVIVEQGRQSRLRDSPVLLYGASLVAAIAIGALGELAQLAFTRDRHAEWNDLANDALGATLGLCFHALVKQRSLAPAPRYRLVALIIVLVGILSTPLLHTSAAYIQRRHQAPELITWNSALGHHFLHADSARINLQSAPQGWQLRPDEKVLHIVPDGRARWPGILLEEPLADWRGYRALEVELINPHEQPLSLTLRIDDGIHNQEYADRYNGHLQVAGKTRLTRRIPLSDIERSPKKRLLQLNNIARLMLFQDSTVGAQDFYLCGIHLVP